MGPKLVWAVTLASAAGCAASEFLLFRMVLPPDASSALLAALWVAMPYLAAVGLAALLSRNTTALGVLLAALLIAGLIGVYLFSGSATQQANAERQAREAVLPGEDPTRGAAAMRKTGADAGAAITGAFSILVVLVVPPAQLAAVVIPAAIGYGVSALRARRAGGQQSLGSL